MQNSEIFKILFIKIIRNTSKSKTKWENFQKVRHKNYAKFWKKKDAKLVVNFSCFLKLKLSVAVYWTWSTCQWLGDSILRCLASWLSKVSSSLAIFLLLRSMLGWDWGPIRLSMTGRKINPWKRPKRTTIPNIWKDRNHSHSWTKSIVN